MNIRAQNYGWIISSDYTGSYSHTKTKDISAQFIWADIALVQFRTWQRIAHSSAAWIEEMWDGGMPIQKLVNAEEPSAWGNNVTRITFKVAGSNSWTKARWMIYYYQV